MAETITVTQLNNRVKTLLKHGSVNDIWVSGEIFQLKKTASGHYYFTLKDESSSVSAVIFAATRTYLSFEPKEGDKVEAFGRADLYAQNGRYQFIISALKHSGIGDLYVRFEALKSKLKSEGLFEESRKRPIPRYPRRIGVVTSQTGAVIHDIITTSSTRFPADIYLAPAQVQGDGAAKTIVAGIELLDRFGVDVIIIGRGGGSLEELWPFNEESVARAIAACRTPVVSAVGHETDFTISDFVADLRAPTPTGAAALILRDRLETSNDIVSLMNRATTALMDSFWNMENRLDVLGFRLAPDRASMDLSMREMSVDGLMTRADTAIQRMVGDSRARLGMAVQKLSPRHAEEMVKHMTFQVSELDRRARTSLSAMSDKIQARFNMAAAKIDPGRIGSRMEMEGKSIDSIFDRIASLSSGITMECGSSMRSIGSRPETAIKAALEMRASRLEGISRNLEGVNPLNVLNRGYGLITDVDGKVVASVSEIPVGARISVRIRDGTVNAKVESKEERK